MENHKKQGLVTEWHPNGKVKSKKNYKNNQRHGLCIEWYEWSTYQTLQRAYKRQETNYKDGARHGLHSQWYENGQKEYETNYKDGARHGMDSCWYENGPKESVEYFVLAKSYARIDWGKEGNVIKTEIPTHPRPSAAPTKNNHKSQKSQTKHANP